jgi:NADPH:quinone reductase-like Zn-dependent oxidoreductase
MAPGDGSLATVVRVPDGDVVTLEHDVPPTLVAALGLSAVAAERALIGRGALQPGETVVVLGAGGVVGQVAVQLARLHGAGRVVAGCRSDAAAARARHCGADAVVRLDTDDVAALAGRFVEACGGAAHLVVDPLCGAPASAAVLALAEGGRLVNLGSSAGPTAVLDSATLRSRSLSVLGYTNNALTREQRRAALSVVVAHAARGALTVDHEVVWLSAVADAWTRQARAGPTAGSSSTSRPDPSRGDPVTLPLFPTTLVGSYPQPEWLIDRARLAGRFPPRVRARSSGVRRRSTWRRRRTTRRCSRCGRRSAPASTSSPTARNGGRATRTTSRRRSRASTSTTPARRSTAAATPTRCRASSDPCAVRTRCRSTTSGSCAPPRTGPSR